MPQLLRTHLLVERSRCEFKTACGIIGIPGTVQDTFGLTEDRLEGRVSGGAGSGVVAHVRAGFGFPTPAVKWCRRCRNRQLRGEGI